METESKVYQLFGKTQKSVDQDVATMKNWLKNQPHLPEIMEDTKIRNFLALNKFNIEKTKDKIDMYYTIRTVMPDFYADCNPKLPRMQMLFETSYVSAHPQLVDDMYRVYFFKPKQPNTLDLLGAAKLWFDMFEVKLYESCIAGDIIVFDMAALSLADMTNFTFATVSTFWTVYKKVYSLRLKNLYFVNSPPYIHICLTVLKTTLKPKFLQRVRVCPDSEVLKEVFDRKFLPKDYGGDGLSLEELNEMMIKDLAKCRRRFDKLDQLRVDEGLRPVKLEEVLGVGGSFRRLDVD